MSWMLWNAYRIQRWVSDNDGHFGSRAPKKFESREAALAFADGRAWLVPWDENDLNKPRLGAVPTCVVERTATTRTGRSFQYELGRLAAGPPGADFVSCCWYDRSFVRLFGCGDEEATVHHEMLHALGWVRVARSAWICAYCAKDPFAPVPCDTEHPPAEPISR